MKKNNFQKIYTLSIFLIISILFELEIMIHYPKLWIGIIAIGILIILITCLIISDRDRKSVV